MSSARESTSSALHAEFFRGDSNAIGAIMTVFGNLLADITYAAVDPRVSYGGKRKV